jgi:hypothetical protein
MVMPIAGSRNGDETGGLDGRDVCADTIDANDSAITSEGTSSTTKREVVIIAASPSNVPLPTRSSRERSLN